MSAPASSPPASPPSLRWFDFQVNGFGGIDFQADHVSGAEVKIRAHIRTKLSHAGLSGILIRKDKQRVTVDIYTARPGIVIGKSGVEVDALRKELHALTGKNVHINITEIKRPELDAQLVAQSIAEQLQNRVSFRRPHPVFAGLPEAAEYHFVHSFYPDPADPAMVLGATEHGITFPSAIGRGNLVATQCHPEKSGRFGLRILKNFLAWDGTDAQ